MIPSDVRLYTWVDVQEVLTRALEQSSWPEWLLDARVYWDSLAIRTRIGSAEIGLAWLKDLFDPRIAISQNGDHAVLLESNEHERSLPISIEETSDTPKYPRLIPTLERPHVLTPQLCLQLKPELQAGAPSIVAFHSFKGGVGRTLHAFALAEVLADRKVRTLLIDADFEAPGISWMLSKRLPNPPISFADLLAIAHSDSSPEHTVSIELVAQRLQDSFIRGTFVLPAFRSTSAFQRLEIKPGDILQGSTDEFVLTSLLYSLARKLDVQVVVVDLRAGLSELSAGLLLDPRVQRVLVTSGSAQSISGTEVVLDLLGKRAPSTLDEHPVPFVILNQVPSAKTRLEEDSIELRLISALSKTVKRANEDDSLHFEISGPSYFDAALLTLPSDWDDVAREVLKTSIAVTVGDIVQSVPIGRRREDVSEGRENDRDRKLLRDTAGRFIVAETSEGDEFLPITPLRRLVEDHSTILPNCVLVGAKGAGKTYTYLQLLRRKGWADFALAAKVERPTTDALLFPVLQPLNLRSANWLRDRMTTTRLELGLSPSESLDQFQISDEVQIALTQQLHQGQWRELWLDLLAWSIGFDTGAKGAGRRLPEFLKTLGKRVVFLFDGLEDIFQDIASSEEQQVALRALLQDVPNWLEQSPESTVGMLIFIRRDLVSAAIRQNSAQLMARYEPYALKWSSTEALRLVTWIASKASVLPQQNSEVIPELFQDALIETLLPLWGRKLGNDRSREGRSAEWVIAALSDFRGQIQARDIVRLLKLAAGGSIGNTTWPDRILVPQAIRDAVTECSTEKIREISEENVQLKKLFEGLSELPFDKRFIPFTSDQVGLTAQELLVLETNGVVVSDAREYYMPEIFRRGLDFRLPQGARPKVLALARQRFEES